jgi:hypothetical protein
MQSLGSILGGQELQISIPEGLPQYWQQYEEKHCHARREQLPTMFLAVMSE